MQARVCAYMRADIVLRVGGSRNPIGRVNEQTQDKFLRLLFDSGNVHFHS